MTHTIRERDLLPANTCEPVHALHEAAHLIDKATYELADKLPSSMVGDLVCLAGTVDQALRNISSYCVQRGEVEK